MYVTLVVETHGAVNKKMNFLLIIKMENKIYETGEVFGIKWFKVREKNSGINEFLNQRLKQLNEQKITMKHTYC